MAFLWVCMLQLTIDWLFLCDGYFNDWLITLNLTNTINQLTCLTPLHYRRKFKLLQCKMYIEFKHMFFVKTKAIFSIAPDYLHGLKTD